MINFPHARAKERDTLIEYVDLKAGQWVLDIQAAGGFLSDEIDKRLAQDVSCICIEPCEELASRLNPRYKWINNPVEQFYHLEDNSIDVALGLCGLHHSVSHTDTIQEVYRVLKPGGQFAFCDVEQGSHIARWLNEFVDQHNSAGHKGNFLKLGHSRQLLCSAGFVSVKEEIRKVPWVFEHREAIPLFFKGLFGLSPTIEEISLVINNYFDVEISGSYLLVDWHLIYCYGEKPLVAKLG